MAVKGKLRRNKTSRRHSKRKHDNKHRRTYRKRTNCRKYSGSGGNYATDATTRETDGIPTKALNKFTVAIPGHPAMSGISYKRLAEAIDRDGHDDV